MSEAIFSAQALNLSFGGVHAVRDVSFQVEHGEVFSIIGPNGAGKTTTLRLLLGFARPDAGAVRLRGRDPSAPASREGVAYLPERPVLPARMTVGDFLRLMGSLAGLEGANLDAEVGAVLDQTGIANREHDAIGGLSKGLAQRVGFAQAFVGRPRLLLLDEPTSGLDPIGVRDARDWIQTARERGCSLLVSSHVLSEIERTCDQVAILHEGKIAASGEISDIVRSDESLEDAFIRVVRG